MAETHRGHGIGRRLVERTTAQLAGVRLWKATIMVYATTGNAKYLCRHLGRKVRDDLQPMQVTL